MALLSLQNITLNLGGRPLLDGATLHVEAGERLCLVGRNGAGKSTLLRLMGGDLRPDAGEVVRAQGMRFGHMPQDVPAHLSGSVYEVVAEGMGPDGVALAAYHRLETGHADSGTLDAARHHLDTGNGWERHGDMMTVLNHLHLDPDARFEELSGGLKRRALLARALVSSSDVLLDEPTNHLDIEAISWLEDFLQRRARTLVFVTHDRTFLRHLATRIVELDRGQLFAYDCGYDAYLERREERLENETRQNALFDKKLAQEEAWIRQGVKARRTRNMGRVRALQALRSERAERRERMGTAAMRVHEAERSGKLVIEATGVTFAHGDSEPVLRDVDVCIQRGDRVGLIGPNGAGKTTLLRILLGDLEPQQGRVRHGTRLEVAYFDQMREALDIDANAMDNVANGNDRVTVNGVNRHVAGYLREFLFDDDRMRIAVRHLSGGERNRLLLARLFLRPSNVLVLDEPTNDLDVETLELLEELLTDYSGTVLLVSHDRTFLDNVVTSTIALEGQGIVREYIGGYEDWLRQRDEPQRPAREARDVATATQPAERRAVDTRPRKLTFKEQRELAEARDELEQLPARLEALETEQAVLERRLADPASFGSDMSALTEAGERLASLEEQQLTLLERWEELEARIAELEMCRS
ncbi:ATP-binding cassette domain-containing protein [Nitratidesulfovibrio vulgaris]|uniref:ATP-binding cassette domain-containing protein n=1 Tax=Nitratidesulfovibrio vulgaris TaxID=881 RepID=UPI0023004851|nr:ATP-binding cassette domain-containing protein [Nitratidesulfovibrio vulgaris]WCB45523.1 ATP-binding cassette domain-containing protein [Nitratidesulfovibrio vulgaris]